MASAMTGEKATMKSSLLRALDCCVTSVTEEQISNETRKSKPRGDGACWNAGAAIWLLQVAEGERLSGCCPLTVGKINEIQPLRAGRVFKLLEPQLHCAICTSSASQKASRVSTSPLPPKPSIIAATRDFFFFHPRLPPAYPHTGLRTRKLPSADLRTCGT